ncbi:MAG: acyltransferase [Gammaproteobacteria bacterium]|nr:MAG: acyltransferase [Gammaproteobacteria bacterium]
MGGKVRIYRRHARIEVGAKVRFWPGVRLRCEGRDAHHPARLVIGPECQIGDRTEIHCAQEVVLEEGVLIAWDCVILDRDYHSPPGRAEGMAPVRIGRRAWLGCRVIVLKGVRVGEGAVIGAGSVVTRDIPPHTLAAGNPARVIRSLCG